jgi:hypothetical protein
MAISDKYLVKLQKPGPPILELVLYDYTNGKDNDCIRRLVGPIPLLVDDTYDPVSLNLYIFKNAPADIPSSKFMLPRKTRSLSCQKN